MNPGAITGIIPENILSKMDPKDRAELGQKTNTDRRAEAIAKDEKEIQKQVAGYLRLLNVWFTASRMDRRTSNAVGTPDFILPYKGHAVFFECKCAWSRALRPEQAKAREEIIKQGGVWALVTSLAEAQACLRELDGIQPRRETAPASLQKRFGNTQPSRARRAHEPGRPTIQDHV